jgi:hypothetical protein
MGLSSRRRRRSVDHGATVRAESRATSAVDCDEGGPPRWDARRVNEKRVQDVRHCCFAPGSTRARRSADAAPCASTRQRGPVQSHRRQDCRDSSNSAASARTFPPDGRARARTCEPSDEARGPGRQRCSRFDPRGSAIVNSGSDCAAGAAGRSRQRNLRPCPLVPGVMKTLLAAMIVALALPASAVAAQATAAQSTGSARVRPGSSPRPPTT